MPIIYTNTNNTTQHNTSLRDMKEQSVHVLLNFILCALLLLSHSISARPLLALAQYQAEKEVKADGIAHVTTFKGVQEDLVKLMGSEECDEECMNRRMIAEAHLDYIYTQNHKP